jgi:hypothetical protein
MWCPLGDEILDHAVWIDFERKLDVTFNSVEYFVGCFPSILGDINRDNLNEQFLQYQFMSINDVPENLKEACHYTDDDHPCRIDALWSYLRTVNTPGTKIPQFDLLFRVAETILTIPHSNASEERIFSYISKCKTPSRSSIHLDGSLSSIMVLKTHISDPLEWKPTKEVLEKAKGATWQYNRMKKQN